MNTIQEMNTAQLHVDPEKGDNTRNPELPAGTPQRHNYNLRPRPTRTNTNYDMHSMTQSGNTQRKIAKPHISC